MIRTDVVELDFIGDGMTRFFDVQLEGIPESPEGKDNFRVTVFTAEESDVERMLEYGVDYRYETVFDARGFPISMRLELADALPVGQKLVILRTTPILNYSEYPDNGVPPRQVEGDFDHVIKILQELDFNTKRLEATLENEIKERIEADEEIWEELDKKVNKDDPIAAHAWQHAEGDFDEVTPESIGALRKAPATGLPYLATTSVTGTPGWIEFVSEQGHIAPTTVVQTGYFTTDGTSKEFSVTHTINSQYINAIVYDEATNKAVHFPVSTPDSETVVLITENILPANRRFRVLMYGPGRIDPAWLNGTYEHVQATPAKTWNIKHDMTNKAPVVLVLDQNKNEVVGTVDYANATDDTISVSFYEDIAGTAIVYGWYQSNRGVVVRPQPFVYRQAQPSNSWLIRHNLDETRPTVLVLDNSGNEMTPLIGYSSATNNTITLTFYEQVSGTAIIGAR